MVTKQNFTSGKKRHRIKMAVICNTNPYAAFVKYDFGTWGEGDYTRHAAPTFCLPFKSAWASVLINRRRHNEPTQTDRSTWHNVRLDADQRNIRKPETKPRRI